MEFELVGRDAAERAARQAYEAGRLAGRAEAAATRPPPRPKPAKAKPPTRHARPVPPKPRVIEHICPNVNPMSSHRGHVVIGTNGKGECDWCHRIVWADS